MEIFIKLTRPSGNDVWLNVGAIVWFAPCDVGTRSDVGTRIVVARTLTNDLIVKENPEEVVERLQSAKSLEAM